MVYLQTENYCGTEFKVHVCECIFKKKKNTKKIKVHFGGSFLAVQWLGLCTSTAERFNPDQDTKIP